MQIEEYEETHEIIPKHEPVPKKIDKSEVDTPPPDEIQEDEGIWAF